MNIYFSLLVCNQHILYVDVGRIGIGICYDIRFQELAAIYAARGMVPCHYDIVISIFQMIFLSKLFLKVNLTQGSWIALFYSKFSHVPVALISMHNS